jgi:hypothetical protein
MPETAKVRGVELWEGLADARAGRGYPSKQIAADLVARRGASLRRRHV